MRLLSLSDFKATGWNINAPAIQPQVNGIVASQIAVFAKYGITQNIQVVHLMAQISHECGEGSFMTESLNYRPAVLMQQWPTHFTPAQAMQYGRTDDHPADQKMIGEIAYGGRMGNAASPSADGYNYRGRGLIQTTGKNAYAALYQLTGLDLVGQPELITDPAHAFECAVAEFVHYPNMLQYCEQDDLKAVSALINVGHLVADSNKINGYADRLAQLTLWKHQYGF